MSENFLPHEQLRLDRRQFIAALVIGAAAAVSVMNGVDQVFSEPAPENSGWLNPGSHWENLSTGEEIVFGVGPDTGVLADWQRWEELENKYVAVGENGQHFGYRMINPGGDLTIIRETGWSSSPFALHGKKGITTEGYNMVAIARAHPNARVIMSAKFGHEGADGLTRLQRQALGRGEFGPIGTAYATGYERAGIDPHIMVGDSLGARNTLAIVHSGILAVKAAGLIDPLGASEWRHVLDLKSRMDQEVPNQLQLQDQSPDVDQTALMREASRVFNSRIRQWVLRGKGPDMLFHYPNGMRQIGLETELSEALKQPDTPQIDWYIPEDSIPTRAIDAIRIADRLKTEQPNELEVLLGKQATHSVFQAHEYLIAQGVIPRLIQRAEVA